MDSTCWRFKRYCVGRIDSNNRLGICNAIAGSREQRAKSQQQTRRGAGGRGNERTEKAAPPASLAHGVTGRPMTRGVVWQMRGLGAPRIFIKPPR